MFLKGVRTLLFGGLLFIAACSDQKPRIPGRIIPQEKMAQVLTDIHLAEAYVTSGLQNDSSEIKGPDYYPFIFKKYGIDEKTFRESFDFYLLHPKLLDKVYQDVMDEMAKKEAEAGKSK